MRRYDLGHGLILLAACSLALCACSQEPTSVVEVFQEPAQGWTEVWRDDFNGDAQSAPDAMHWNVEVNPSPYNMELEYQTNERRNSFLDGTGNLVIQAIQEHYVDASGATSAQ